MGPYPIIEVRSPQVVVLKELNSKAGIHRMQDQNSLGKPLLSLPPTCFQEFLTR